MGQIAERLDIRLAFNVSHDLRERLRATARRNRRPIGEEVRWALEAHLDRADAALDAQTPTVDGGRLQSNGVGAPHGRG